MMFDNADVISLPQPQLTIGVWSPWSPWSPAPSWGHWFWDV